MANSRWTANDIPNQQGRTIIITGASSGLGKEAVRVLAHKNARLIMAVRNTEKGEKVRQTILQENAQANIEVRALDLSSLTSVKAFAKSFLKEYDQLDVLINNAGVMMCPYSETEDGFEIQMGTNHFGHFALTGLLMPLLTSTPDSRIVATSSIAHRTGDIQFDDIHWKTRSYDTGDAYSDSKLANLYFTYELARKLEGKKGAPMVTCAHPGWTKTDLDRHSGMARFLGFMAQPVEMGTLPTLRAAFDPKAATMDYFGPSRFMQARGYPAKVASNKKSMEKAPASKLWKLSETLTGVSF